MSIIEAEAETLEDSAGVKATWQSRDLRWWRLVADNTGYQLLSDASDRLLITPEGEVCDHVTGITVRDNEAIRAVGICLATAGYGAWATRVHFWFLDH
jgi:hypothetical protein